MKLCMCVFTFGIKMKIIQQAFWGENASVRAFRSSQENCPAASQNSMTPIRVHLLLHLLSATERQLIVGQALARQRSYNYVQISAQRLPNKMTLAVSSRLIRWALWASRHLRGSRMEGRASKARTRLCSSTYPTFLLFTWKQMTDSHSGVFPGQWKTLWLQ